jgi:WD40 repeat protein
MRRTLAARLSRAVVGCYPRRWRQRYGEELLAVLDQHHPGVRTVLDLAAGALGAHLDPAWRIDGLAMVRRHKDVLGIAAACIAGLMVVVLMVGGWWIAGWWSEEHGSPIPLSQGVAGVAFSPDGRLAAVIGTSLELWDVADRAHPKRLNYTHGDNNVGGEDPAFSPGGRVLATCGGSVTLWNVADPARLTQLAVLPANPGGVNAVAFSPDGRILASGLGDGTVVLWNVADPAHATHIATLTGQAGNLTGLAFSPDGHLLASASPNGTVFLWNVADPARATRTATLTRQAGGVSAVSFSPDGQLLASASDGGTVVLRNIANPAAPVITATLRFTVPASDFAGMAIGPDVALAFSADGRTLTSIAGNTAVTLWNVTNPDLVSRITTVTGDTIGDGEVGFAAGGRIVAGAPTTGDTLALWTLP